MVILTFPVLSSSCFILSHASRTGMLVVVPPVLTYRLHAPYMMGHNDLVQGSSQREGLKKWSRCVLVDRVRGKNLNILAQ